MFIADKFKRVMRRYDLALVEEKAYYDLARAKVDRLKNSTSLKGKSGFIYWSSEEEKSFYFIKDLLNAREKFLNNIRIILSRYNFPYKEVFIDHFLRDKKPNEIALELKIEVVEVEKTIKDLRKDLDLFYI